MQLFTSGLGRKLISPTLLLVFLFTFALATSLSWYTAREARKNSEILGGALVLQLAQTAQEPLIHNNAISLQVVVDRLVAETPGLIRASVFNAENRLVAESLRPPGNEPRHTYSLPITIEDAIAGSARVELQHTTGTDIVWIAVGLWLAAVLMYLGWQAKTVSRLTQRIDTINRALIPEGMEKEDLDELGVLEARIQPFLIHGQPFDSPEPPENSCLLALHCANLPRLRVQLNNEHFNTLLDRIDRAISAACRLYDGNRHTSDPYCIYLKFTAADDNGDHVLRALGCASALLQLCSELVPAQGIPLEMKAALGSLDQDRESPRWLREAAESEKFAGLRNAGELAEPWEILVDTSIAGEPAVDNSIETEPLIGESQILRLRGFTEPQASMLEHQIQYLRTQLPPSLSEAAYESPRPDGQPLH